MEAAHELDAKVAEALGWNHNERLRVWITPTMYYPELPEFSTSWEGMGVLVEEAVKRGFTFQIETRFMDGGLIDYRCLSIGEDRDIVHGFGDTAPQAVCRAFLKAKGVEI